MTRLIMVAMTAMLVAGFACDKKPGETQPTVAAPETAADEPAAETAKDENEAGACVELFALAKQHDEAEGKAEGLTPERIKANYSKGRMKLRALINKARDAETSEDEFCQVLLDEMKAREADKQAKDRKIKELLGGGDPMGKALDHQEAMLKILEANMDSPDSAGKALEKYHADNKADFDAIKEQGEKMEAKMKDDPEAAMKMFAKYADRLKTITERARKLTDAHPDLMMNEGVQKAMAGLR